MDFEPFRFSVTQQEHERHPRAQGVLAAQISVSALFADSFHACSALKGKLCRDIYGDLPYGAYVVPEVVLSGDGALIALSDGRLIREQNAGLLEHDELLDELESFKQSPVTGEAARLKEAVSLLSTCTDCFWHWMMDSLPKVVLAEESGFSGSYIVPAGELARAAIESLALLGIGAERCVPYSISGCVVERLWIPTYFSGFNASCNPAFIKWYRERLLSSARISTDSPKYMYVARKSSARNRRVINHDEVERILQSHGFETVFFEDLTLREQISRAAQASIIVAPHGSGLTHSLFMNEGSALVELFPFQRRSSCDCYERLATVMNHRYVSLETEADRGEDLFVDLEKLRTTLGAVLR